MHGELAAAAGVLGIMYTLWERGALEMVVDHDDPCHTAWLA